MDNFQSTWCSSRLTLEEIVSSIWMHTTWMVKTNRSNIHSTLSVPFLSVRCAWVTNSIKANEMKLNAHRRKKQQDTQITHSEEEYEMDNRYSPDLNRIFSYLTISCGRRSFEHFWALKSVLCTLFIDLFSRIMESMRRWRWKAIKNGNTGMGDVKNHKNAFQTGSDFMWMARYGFEFLSIPMARHYSSRVTQIINMDFHLVKFRHFGQLISSQRLSGLISSKVTRSYEIH